MIALGVDPGLAVCGLVLAERDARGWYCLQAKTVETKPDRPQNERIREVLEHAAELGGRNTRAILFEDNRNAIAGAIRRKEHNKDGLAVLLVIGGLMEIARRNRIPCLGVEPNRIKKALTGSGRASKQQMKACACVRVRGLPEEFSDHVADACGALIAGSGMAPVSALLVGQSGGRGKW